MSREQTVLKNLYYVKKGDTSAGARRAYIAVVFAGASERDLEGKFRARHFEMNAEHGWISRKPASIRAHLLFPSPFTELPPRFYYPVLAVS